MTLRVLVIGSGIAGLTAARHAREAGHEVLLVTKHELAAGCTARAQGGIAGAVFPDDTVDSHVNDTLRAGAGHCDTAAVRVLCEAGAESIHELAAQGVAFDTDARGEWSRGLEGAHSIARVVHAGGDATGARIHEALVAAARHAGVRMLEHRRLRELLIEDGRVVGAQFVTGLAEPTQVAAPTQVAELVEVAEPAQVADPVEVSDPSVASTGSPTESTEVAELVEVSDPLVASTGSPTGAELVEVHEADAIILATGGFGGLYPFTTNPDSATGDGVVIAHRAGAEVTDLEFMQFHPTVLAVGEPFLISEAVRGEGAHLIDESGRRFMTEVDPRAELAPRDVVARAIAQLTLRPRNREGARSFGISEATHQGAYLDATRLGKAFLASRFPTIDSAVRARGLDWSREPIPVRPGAHFAMGGVATDLWGRTTLPGLYAVGEVACTGVHGANRLASNSLLEGAVFGARVVRAIGADAEPGECGHFDTACGLLNERGGASGLLNERGGLLNGRSVSRSGATYRSDDEYGHFDTACGLLNERGGAGGLLNERGALQAPPFSRAALKELMWEHVGLIRTAQGLQFASEQIAIWQAARHLLQPDDRDLLELAELVTQAATRRTASLGAHFRADDSAAEHPAPRSVAGIPHPTATTHAPLREEPKC